MNGNLNTVKNVLGERLRSARKQNGFTHDSFVNALNALCSFQFYLV